MADDTTRLCSHLQDQEVPVQAAADSATHPPQSLQACALYRAGTAADVFQFAILAWELITRDVPIRGALRNVAVPEECPRNIAGLLAGCMARNVAHRPTIAQVGPGNTGRWSVDMWDDFVCTLYACAHLPEHLQSHTAPCLEFPS